MRVYGSVINIIYKIPDIIQLIIIIATKYHYKARILTQMNLSKIKFGFVIPQGWRNDLPRNSSVAQFKYSQEMAIMAEKMALIQLMHTIILFHTTDILKPETFLSALPCYPLYLQI